MAAPPFAHLSGAVTYSYIGTIMQNCVSPVKISPPVFGETKFSGRGAPSRSMVDTRWI
jgi:hypothetical protein